jgi:hypothetical protein
VSDEASSWLRHLKTLGQSQGFLTFAQVNESLPLAIVDPEEIERIVDQLKHSGISVVPNPPAGKVPSLGAGEVPRRSNSMFGDTVNDDDSFEVRAAKAELLSAMNQLRAVEGHAPIASLPEPPLCSFCGRSKNEMGALVQGNQAFICVECADEARRSLLRDE